MSYKDRLLTGSFRNVSFFIDAHTFEGGRRVVLHEFPERDEPFAEDLGRRAQTYTIEAHIIGQDYFEHRDRLIRALEKKNHGILIHPYLGRKDVVCTGFSMSEDNQEGRICRFSLNFSERGRPLNPAGIFGAIFGVFNQINALFDDLQEEFDAIMEIASFPGFVVDSAFGIFDNVVDTFNEAIGLVPATLATFDQVKNGIFDYGNSIPSIITSPISLFTSTKETQQSLTTITNKAGDKEKIIKPFLTFNDDFETSPYDTPSRTQEKENAKAITRMIQGIAVAETVSWFVQAATRPFDVTDPEQNSLENDTIKSIGDLQEKRDEVVEIIDNFIEKHGDFPSRQSFVSLKGKMLNALPINSSATDLKLEQKIKPLDTLPSLVIVYDRFETIDADDDFIQRNKIPHPAFVSGGNEYEIVEV